MQWDWQLAGAFVFGLVLGWNLYFVNRYRKGEIGFGDLGTLIGAVGGAAVLTLFEAKTNLFGAYGVGLGVGFFLYFAFLVGTVNKSDNFNADWFLDGRRKNPAEGEGYGTEARGTVTPAALQPSGPAGSGTVNHFYGVNPGDMHSLAPSGVAGKPPASDAKL
jgi:hypothetical protein